MHERRGMTTGLRVRPTESSRPLSKILTALVVMTGIGLWPAAAMAGLTCEDDGPPGAPAALSPAGQQGYLPVLPTYEWTCVAPTNNFFLKVWDGRGVVHSRRLSIGPLGCGGFLQCTSPTCSWPPGPSDYFFNLAPGATTWTVQSFGPNGYGPLSEIEEVTVVDPIFNDDFESGGLDTWSLIEPPS